LDELDLLAGLLRERRDDLRNRFVRLGIEPFLPPDREIGGAGGKRRQGDRCGENNGSSARRGASPGASWT
jgi:hypothetical protein